MKRETAELCRCRVVENENRFGDAVVDHAFAKQAVKRSLFRSLRWRERQSPSTAEDRGHGPASDRRKQINRSLVERDHTRVALQHQLLHVGRRQRQ